MHAELTDVGHRFGDRPWLFRHLDLRLEPGRVYALTGPSGSGKSTLLGILAGWIEPVEGSVRRPGVTDVGWVFQSPHGVARRTVEDHVALPLVARGLRHAEARARGRELLDRFGLGGRAASPFRELSGGEAQRLMLARAMAATPDLLLVDEPTAQLDRTTSLAVSGVISRLADDGTIVVVATHDEHTRDACTDLVDLAAIEAAGDGAAPSPVEVQV